MWDFGIFNNYQKFKVCGNIISAQISKKKNDSLKSADFGTLIYERTHMITSVNILLSPESISDFMDQFRIWSLTIVVVSFQ